MNDTENSLLALHELGQAIWLDGIDRQRLMDGTLERLIEADGIAGLSTNPATFEKAIEQDENYQAAIEKEAKAGHSATEIYERLLVEDVRLAADRFQSLYRQTEGQEGFVSLEISPLLAHDTEATVNEARRLWQWVDRPNAMIAIPGTKAGLPAIEQLISEGINVNVTLLFSVGRYLEMTHAYMTGLEKRLAAGQPIQRVASVASFFLGRIDLKVDRLLDEIAKEKDPQRVELARGLRGKAALASAGFAYERFEEFHGKPLWEHLAEQGGRKQRLLWASTSTEDPLYSDIKYVDSLIGPETVNAMPIATLEAYREHGQPEIRIWTAVHEAPEIMHRLAELKIDLRIVDENLEKEGIAQFIEPYQQLLATLEQRRRQG
ncbi:transaldolase [Nitrosococcus halophilus Nc 4]|uniref:Transaldolase n=1 Tax=Nitrosococcus halophilus (strain Nc4) TaxID=472759 RepID=D5BY07_NITHN|nr:transaldolase [Nitrosococcus halophilus]ADE15918.1 transaldolase [Nitrosococcus halophilus Nc 4]